MKATDVIKLIILTQLNIVSAGFCYCNEDDDIIVIHGSLLPGYGQTDIDRIIVVSIIIFLSMLCVSCIC